MSPTADRPHKLRRIVEILDARGAESIALTQPENLAWFFDGARTGVPYGGPAVFSAVIHRDGTAVVSALENEVDRLGTEEISGAEIGPVPWYSDLSSTDEEPLSDTEVTAELRRARATLLPVERERYRVLGRDAAAAMTQALQQARPSQSERELAADLARAIIATGADPSVILIAGESRGGIQHPLPTGATLGDRAMAVVTAKRHGLHVSLTRWVRFRGAETAAERAIHEVEADAFAATRPGRQLGEVLADIAASYKNHGFGTAEHPAWRAHHQGGPTGYLGRDPKAAPDSTVEIMPGGAFAWNPWVPHAKIEDTVIIDHDSVEVLSSDPSWPTVDVRGVRRPTTLDLS